MRLCYFNKLRGIVNLFFFQFFFWKGIFFKKKLRQYFFAAQTYKMFDGGGLFLQNKRVVNELSQVSSLLMFRAANIIGMNNFLQKTNFFFFFKSNILHWTSLINFLYKGFSTLKRLLVFSPVEYSSLTIFPFFFFNQVIDLNFFFFFFDRKSKLTKGFSKRPKFFLLLSRVFYSLQLFGLLFFTKESCTTWLSFFQRAYVPLIACGNLLRGGSGVDYLLPLNNSMLAFCIFSSLTFNLSQTATRFRLVTVLKKKLY